MSSTPRTDAIREKINASDDCHAEDICTALDFAEKLERENATLRLALSEMLRLSSGPYERTMGQWAEWCAAKGVAHSLLRSGFARDLARENAELRATLDQILTDKNYVGGVQFWIQKHDALLAKI